MSRQVIDGRVGINLSLGSASTVPEFTPGDTVLADSGAYRYLQANGAVVEGYLCKFVEGTFDADTCTTAESGSVHTLLGANVTSGGLADNYWGWFWVGDYGQEYVYVQDIATDTQVTTTTTAGQGGSGGDNVDGLFTNENNAAAALTLCRATSRFCTNFTTSAT